MLVNELAYFNDTTIINPLIDDARHYTQYISLCGANGSGRDVLLKQIERSFTPSHLQSFFDNERDHLSFAQKDIGLVLAYPEEQLLDMNVLFNVMNSLFTFNYTLSNTRRKSYDALDFVGIPRSHFSKMPQELSLYEQRKIILASFLAIDTKIIIFDDPTAGLNNVERQELLHILYEANTSKNRTLLILNEHSHDIVNFTDQVFGFKEGKLSILGLPNVYHQQAEALNFKEEEVLHEIIYNAEIDL